MTQKCLLVRYGGVRMRIKVCIGGELTGIMPKTLKYEEIKAHIYTITNVNRYVDFSAVMREKYKLDFEAPP